MDTSVSLEAVAEASGRAAILRSPSSISIGKHEKLYFRYDVHTHHTIDEPQEHQRSAILNIPGPVQLISPGPITMEEHSDNVFSSPDDLVRRNQCHDNRP
jgi:hypothetical protein